MAPQMHEAFVKAKNKDFTAFDKVSDQMAILGFSLTDGSSSLMAEEARWIILKKFQAAYRELNRNEIFLVLEQAEKMGVSFSDLLNDLRKDEQIKEIDRSRTLLGTKFWEPIKSKIFSVIEKQKVSEINKISQFLDTPHSFSETIDFLEKNILFLKENPAFRKQVETKIHLLVGEALFHTYESDPKTFAAYVRFCQRSRFCREEKAIMIHFFSRCKAAKNENELKNVYQEYARFLQRARLPNSPFTTLIEEFAIGLQNEHNLSENFKALAQVQNEAGFVALLLKSRFLKDKSSAVSLIFCIEELDKEKRQETIKQFFAYLSPSDFHDFFETLSRFCEKKKTIILYSKSM